VPADIADLPTTIPALLAERAEHDADLRALVTDDDAVTYAELDERSAALAARFVAAGVVKGDRLAVLAPNGIGWAVTAFAAMRIGAVLVPLSTLLRPPELLAQLQVASVSHLVTTPTFRDRDYLADLEHAAPGLVAAVQAGDRHPSAPALRAVWLIDEIPATAAPAELVAAMAQRVTPADDLAIMFTSGSRGLPKGVIHTHGGAIRATAVGLDARCVGPGERLYIPMPFFWMGGFGSGLLTAVVAGATLLTEAEPEPTATLALLERERATLFRGWPDQAARLAAHPGFDDADLSSLGDGSLGAVLPADRRPAPGARANLFGMTESFGPYCGDRADVDMPADKWGSCGRPFEGVEVRIVDPETGEHLPPGEQGEIWLRGPNILRGMCGRDRSTVFTRDGHHRTGDLGRLDADGYLWYAGRLDDMFKVKGATVYPSEVEAALRAVDGVRQAYVTDVAHDGQRQVAALVLTERAPADLRGDLKARLSSFKVPTVWLATPDATVVPMMATGKVDKAALQALLENKGETQ
jgi:acyl-CoA synthetase (AMP-forming)/AMP-acid ligase II